MKILVANLGSTSFKFRLFETEAGPGDLRQIARGGVDRIGGAQSDAELEIGDRSKQLSIAAPDHAAAIAACMEALLGDEGCLTELEEVAAIGFKAVHGGRVSGVRRVDDQVLDAMAEMNDVCPAHNPPYLAAMHGLRERLPDTPLVAAFETGFHDTVPQRLRVYAAPYQWADDYSLKRWGFHGASHRYIAERMQSLTGNDRLRLISCHLGGSSSICASRGGKSVAVSMGMSPQTGLPQNNRVGDFDPFALPYLAKRMDTTIENVLEILSTEGGLLGISGTSGDIRDLTAASAQGDDRAQLALDVLVTNIRHYLGAYLVELGGVDAIAFTGGIGQHQASIRSGVCAGLEEFGIAIDEKLNEETHDEGAIQNADSRVAIWVVPTNEELIVARQTLEAIG